MDASEIFPRLASGQFAVFYFIENEATCPHKLDFYTS